MKANKTLLQMKYARIITLFSQKAHISELEALDFFYNSHTYIFMREGISDFHCLSDDYLADELLAEKNQCSLSNKKNKS